MGKKNGGGAQTQSKRRRHPCTQFYTPSAILKRHERAMRRVRRSSGEDAAKAYAKKYIAPLK